MSFCGKLDPMVNHNIQFAFNGKRKHIEKTNMKDIAYPNQQLALKYHMVQKIM